MVFLECKMALHLRPQTDRQVGQQTCNVAGDRTWRPTAPIARQKLLKSLHQSDSCVVLVMQRLADPIGEAHASSLTGRGRTKIEVCR